MQLDFPASDTVIYQSDALAAVYSPPIERRSNILVVTFTALNDRNEPLRGLSRDTLRDAGFAVVHVNDGGNRWYQYPDIHQLLAVIAQFARSFEETVTYGLSMGGYAALHSSRALGASRTVSFAPQFSLDRKKVAFEDRWRSYVDGVDFIWDDFASNVSASADHFVIYDPLSADEKHVREISARIAVKALRVPFGGHHVWEMFLRADIIDPTLFELLAGRYEINSGRRELRALRSNCPIYWQNMAMRSPRWREIALTRADSLRAPVAPQAAMALA